MELAVEEDLVLDGVVEVEVDEGVEEVEVLELLEELLLEGIKPTWDRRLSRGLLVDVAEAEEEEDEAEVVGKDCV